MPAAPLLQDFADFPQEKKKPPPGAEDGPAPPHTPRPEGLSVFNPCGPRVFRPAGAGRWG